MQLSTITKALLLSACLFTQSTFAQDAKGAEPVENKVAQISRTAASGNTLTGSLSKNLFRTETYDAPYTIQVPYEATETYTENIPYQVEVPYTDYITEYRQEYRCRNVTRYRQECHNQQRCYTVPGSPGQCRMVEECGVNVHGQRVCKTRQVCDGGSGPQQRCDTQQVCSNVPYTDQQCAYENVAYQTPVTRYRTETRYRQETRTRIVTRYRDEVKCCRPATREVFDKQLQYQVSVHFPQNSDLLAGESELLNINLISADENSAHVGLQNINSVFTYVIASQSVTGATINVELAMVPKFDLNNAGISSIQNLLLQFVKPPKKFQLSFNDTILSSRVNTTYKVIVTDEAGNKVEEQSLAPTANGVITAILNNVTDKKAKIKATIQVLRSGILVSNSQIAFDVSVLPTKKD